MLQTLSELGLFGIAFALGLSMGILVALALLARRWPKP